MILTVTPNPSVDRTVLVARLARGQVIRARRSWREPSGKGINVALALDRAGVAAAAVLPVGGPTGAELLQLLAVAGLTVHPVPVDGSIRANISIVEPDGTVTKLNEPGPDLSPAEVAALVRAVTDRLTGATWLACCGSLPPGAPVDLYAVLAELGHARGIPVAVDSSGAPLRAALEGHPDLVKPNAPELAELVGRSLRTLGDVLDAAEAVRTLGAGAVLASLGADGLVLVDATGAVHAEAPAPTVVSAVGAGDAALAGFLSPGRSAGSARSAGTARGARTAEGLRAAAAWGAAAVSHEGTLFPGVDPAQRVVVHRRVDRARRLGEPAIATG